MQALWIGLGLFASGMDKLGANVNELPAGSGRDAFSAGMAARSGATGDVGDNDPLKWDAAFRSKGSVDAVLIVASDSMTELDKTVDRDGLQGQGDVPICADHSDTTSDGVPCANRFPAPSPPGYH